MSLSISSLATIVRWVSWCEFKFAKWWNTSQHTNTWMQHWGNAIGGPSWYMQWDSSLIWSSIIIIINLVNVIKWWWGNPKTGAGFLSSTAALFCKDLLCFGKDDLVLRPARGAKGAKKAKISIQNHSFFQTCPLYMFGNRATDGTKLDLNIGFQGLVLNGLGPNL